MSSILSIRLRHWNTTRFAQLLIVAGLLALAIAVTYRPLNAVAIALLGLVGIALVLLAPQIGLYALTVFAIVFNIKINTGTDVPLYPAFVIAPALVSLWLFNKILQRDGRFVVSRVNRPLALFLIAVLISLLVGNGLWDPIIPIPPNFIWTQLGQIGIYAFSAGVFWLVGNLFKDTQQLRRLTWCFFLVAGLIAILRAFPAVWVYVDPYTTNASFRAPYWIALLALAGGQLLYNRELTTAWRVYLLIICVACLVYAFGYQSERTSNWLSLGIVIYLLPFLRFPRLRPLLVVVAILGATVFFPLIYQFGGGDAKWLGSGAPRLVLSGRTIELTMRDPIFGLGPAAYRQYGFQQPLVYGQAFWIRPSISAHNNYVDIFAQTGIVGLGLFLWFMAELVWLGLRLRRIYPAGFTGGYVNGMLAALASICAAMLLLDWFLPFIYNVSLDGFEASVLLWMFFGGLLALEGMSKTANEKT